MLSSTAVLLSDPAVRAIPVHECGESLTRLPAAFGPARALVRPRVAAALAEAAALLPSGIALRVVEGHRRARDQKAIIQSYRRELAARNPRAGAAELERLASRFVAPLDVAPHVAGAAVDLTLVDHLGRPLDLGTPIDATPEASAGACYLDHEPLPEAARANRLVLRTVLDRAGLVNYPTEWWHWSLGDRYWALVTGADAAVYGPVNA